MMRNCPRCKEQTLAPYSFDKLAISKPDGGYGVVKGIVVELCERCSGLFFHAKGLEILSGETGSLLINDAVFVEENCPSCGQKCLPDEKNCSSCGILLGLACSVCDGQMRLARFLGVELDICQVCHATWFDDGELSKVVRRYRRRKRRGEGKEEVGSLGEDTLAILTCIRCEKEGLRPRDVYKTPEGSVCRTCMDKAEGEGRGLSVGMMNDGSVASNVVDSMVTLTVVDAIFDLFSK